MRVAAVQAEAVPGELDANVAKAVRLIAEADADLVLFPEAFTTGYDERVFARPLPTEHDPLWGTLQAAADTHGRVVVMNTALDRGDRRTLTDVVLAPGAEPWFAYDKQHMYAAERELFTPGGQGASFTLDGTTVALSICYDADFPEHAAAAAADGATVYLASGAYFPGGERRRDLHYGARALDNGIHVVFAGLVGAPHDFIGGSAIFDPLGNRIAHVDTREGLAIAELDPRAIAEARASQNMWQDRRATLGPRVSKTLEQPA